MNRPNRKMPPVDKIIKYWLERGNPFGIDVNGPACFRYRCPSRVSSWLNLQRSHLVSRHLNGLDNESNLVMLCDYCNQRAMPDFGVDEYESAVLWVLGFVERK